MTVDRVYLGPGSGRYRHLRAIAEDAGCGVNHQLTVRWWSGELRIEVEHGGGEARLVFDDDDLRRRFLQDAHWSIDAAIVDWIRHVHAYETGLRPDARPEPER